jgi:hypothetical protein
MFVLGKKTKNKTNLTTQGEHSPKASLNDRCLTLKELRLNIKPFQIGKQDYSIETGKSYRRGRLSMVDLP